MSEFEATRSKMLSRLDSSQLKRDGSPVGHSRNESTRSTEKDIFRYSYNLGKQRARQFHRTASLAASIGGILTQPNEETFSKALLRRRIPRSLSMQSEIALAYSQEKGASVDMILESKNDVVRCSALNAAPSEASRETGKNETMDVKSGGIRVENNLPAEKFEKKVISNNGECSNKDATVAVKEPIADSRAKALCLSDSVPDLRIVDAEKDKLKGEGFSSFLSHESGEKAQSRPICKLRRAARRLGVSLSSEELYHKQRRNGVCTEIDDAADNRKLLRVLNKRF